MADDYRYTRAEMETIIRFDAEDQKAYIYSADPVYIRKLDKLTESNAESYQCVRVLYGGKAKEYTAPAKLIRFGKPPSEARREAGRRSAQFLSISSASRREKNESSTTDR